MAAAQHLILNVAVIGSIPKISPNDLLSFHSDNMTKHGVEFCQSIPNISKIRRKVEKCVI